MTMPPSRRHPPRGAPEYAGGDPRPCEHPGCTGRGLYPAPRSRHALRSWRWFCLTHVREYNRRWNYFNGCDEVEIGREVREDLGWRRPTWPLGQQVPPAAMRVTDWYGLFRGEPGSEGGAAGGRGPRRRGRLSCALGVLGLRDGASLPAIKARYKSLVKSHHPDANHGDAGATDRLIQINAAYAELLKHHGKT